MLYNRLVSYKHMCFGFPQTYAKHIHPSARTLCTALTGSLELLSGYEQKLNYNYNNGKVKILLETRHLTAFWEIAAVEGISFLWAGSGIQFIGENGAGKTPHFVCWPHAAAYIRKCLASYDLVTQPEQVRSRIILGGDSGSTSTDRNRKHCLFRPAQQYGGGAA